MANKYAAQAKAAQRRYREWRSCTRKRGYASEAEALAGWTLDGQRVYSCPICTLWHRTSGIRTTLGRVRRAKDR